MKQLTSVFKVIALICMAISGYGQAQRYTSGKGLFQLGFNAASVAAATSSIGKRGAPPAGTPKPGVSPTPIPSVRPGGVAASNSSMTLMTVPASSQPNMGIKYRVFQRVGTCDIATVDSKSVFKSGDQIRFSVETNTDGYLYILNYGTSNTSNYLFPDSRINNGDNAIKKGIEYTFPPADWFKFDNTPGEEKVVVILSKTKVDPLQQSIVQQRQQPSSARSPIGRGLITDLTDQLQLRTRDLVFDQDVAPIQVQSLNRMQVQNTYVVNPKPDSYLITEITLKHTP